MPWKQKSTKMELRLEFVTLAMRESANISSLCRRFGISRTTGYKWIRRYKAEGKEGLRDRSRNLATRRTRPPTVWRKRFVQCADHIRAGADAKSAGYFGARQKPTRLRSTRRRYQQPRPVRASCIAGI